MPQPRKHPPAAHKKALLLHEESSGGSSAELAGDESQFMWAISYSDLLMVMLTFFILFFESREVMEKKPTEEVTEKIKKELKVKEIAPAQPELPAKDKIISTLKKKIDETSMQTEKVGNKVDLVVYFPDNIYSMGEFKLSAGARVEVNRILDILRPYREHLALVFVGHTDEAPVHVFKDQVVDSNIVLSNLRSSYAVNYAMSFGFDPRWVSAQGVAQFARNTRSLSLLIMERD